MSEFEEKVLEMLKTINDKLDKVLAKGVGESAASAAAVDTSAPPPSSAATSGSTTMAKPSAVVEKQEEEEKNIEKPPVEGRRVCPNCESTAFKTEEDRSTVLHQMGGMKIYKKKNICKKCGYEL